ncbi:DNA polymerase IV [Halegenticoccus soli]|uniref:DNA polymerase IV n=1 Tax=Halegenticoccus soli TaxID=1985678 RepID=UPI000C6CBD48|nr:DNA polymerase IV [Halegenticoccus soli]
MSGRTLPGTGTDDDRRIVLHVDMDCFYASCERLREPELEGEPVVVGMGYEPGEGHGAVATASYEAREYGVESAQPISKALEALPRIEDARTDPDLDPADAGHYRPVDLDFYKEVSEQVKEILHDCADVVREVSIDEAYLDVTDRTSWQTVEGTDRTLAEGYARHVRDRIAREVGVPASIGVTPNMSTAKLASDYDKPEGLVVVGPGEVRDFLEPIPVDELHGVGPVTARELREMDVETAGDLAAADPSALRARFGERGRELYDRARGDDDREVTPTGRPKSLSRESAFTEATAETDRKREKVRTLAADVAARARSRDALYRTIGVKVVTPPFDVHTRAKSLPGPVDDPDLVEEVALDLLSEFADDEVRKLGVRVSKLSFSAGDQARLDGWDGSAADAEPDSASDPTPAPPGAAEADATVADLSRWAADSTSVDSTAADATAADATAGGATAGDPPPTDGAASDSAADRREEGQASLLDFE